MQYNQELSPVVSGVYFLFKDRRLVYVGKSSNCYKRIRQHRSNGRDFDHAIIASSPEVDIGWMEKALISELNPPQNKTAVAKVDTEATVPKLKAKNESAGRVVFVSPEPRERPVFLSVAEAIREATDTLPHGWRCKEKIQTDIETGKIPCVKFEGGRWGFRGHIKTEDFDAWMKMQLVEIASLSRRRGQPDG